ncbi:hypothetical protein [Chryseobacterium sp. JUb7]|uniref:hypothetical protein n=1 Tax=Chryseobacterium sp. JUb7 TaxID=2940599 RepID=UPI002169EC7B|nr:hypothetical protein [Chryseobacterium sp. JUb7]MCS3531359.1 ABC-type multidrug transport system fused ATPase/permease subunit [Chryseobacterium sp. JUb7]
MNVQHLTLIFLIIVLIIILLVIINIKNLFENISDSTKKTWIFIFSVLGGLFVIVSIFLPYWLTNILSKENLDPNAVGDTIGGTMGPFVAIGGVIFTFLAFYMQKLANDEIKNQFKIQQFESQFYEMLRLHKENVTEIEYINDNKTFKGRKAFEDLYSEFKDVYDVVKQESPKELENIEIIVKSYRIFFME